MSIESTETIKCPACQQEAEFQVWQSINTEINPEMKQAVRDMSAFRFKCPHCGAETNVNYTTLYH